MVCISLGKLVEEPVNNTCNLCGGTTFNGDAYMPACINCKSKTRHRCVKQVFDRYPVETWHGKKLLQLSYEPYFESVRGMFESVEISIYHDDINPLNLESISREDNSYDVIFCNHILEHVKHDHIAIQELYRVLSPGGILFVTVPNPHRFGYTHDWGFPDPNNHDHYRLYGRDFYAKLVQLLPDSKVAAHKLKDPAGFDKHDIVFEIIKQENHNERQIHTD